MSKMPTGTVTFLFTDIEGSTRLWEQYPAEMRIALARHDALLHAAIEQQGGYVFKTAGDSFHAAFPTAIAALHAAVQAQRVLAAEPWGERPIRARMALHSGAAELRENDYHGQALNRTARLMAAGYGGQILLSGVTRELLREHLTGDIEVRDLGERRLRDLIEPLPVFQVVAPDLPSEFPPLKTLDARPNNLPRQATLLIGREREAAAVAGLLRGTEVGLVTLTGPGGTGKTRLSLQVAADLLDEVADGVWFVELAALTDPGLVTPTIAQTLGVKESPDHPLLEGLAGYLAPRQALLVLDNFEQVAGAAPVVTALLRAAPRLKILVTSRIALRLYGEKEYPVPPLAVPDRGALPSLERLTQYEAVRLFIERAQDVKAGFTVTNETAPAVAEICARLDGLPLAIELAAARVRLLPPAALLARLDQRLKVLTGGARDLPGRQQTLRGAISWSYDLLAPGEQQLFRRMAVFQGGRTLPALEAVCNADGDLAIDVLDGVESLVRHSLVQERESSGGDPRFWLLETIHEYAREELIASGEEPALQQRHAAYFLDLLAEAETEWHSPAQARWLQRLDDDHDNLRTAWHWAIVQGHLAAIGQALSVLFLFYDTRGWLQEGEEVSTQAVQALEHLAVAPAVAPERGRVIGALLARQAVFPFRRGHYAEAEALLERSLALLRPVNAQTDLVFALYYLGAVAANQGDLARARAAQEESLARAEAVGDRWATARAFGALGINADSRGDYDAAYGHYQASMTIYRELGDQRSTAIMLNNLGYGLHLHGRPAEARPLLEEALVLARELDYDRLIAHALDTLGAVEYDLGEYDEARRRGLESLARFAELKDQASMAYIHKNLGYTFTALHDHAAAQTHFHAALQLAATVRAVPVALAALVGLAQLLAATGATAPAVALLIQAYHHPAIERYDRDRAAQALAALGADPAADPPGAAPAPAPLAALVESVLAAPLPALADLLRVASSE